MHSSVHLLMTANPPAYFYIMPYVVKVTHKCDNNPHKSVRLSLSQSAPCPPIDIRAVWQSIISPHLQKAFLHHCMGGRRAPHLSLIFILSSSGNGGAVSSNLQLTSLKTHERQQPPHLHVESGVFNVTQKPHHTCWLFSEFDNDMKSIYMRSSFYWIIKNIHGAREQMTNASWRQINKVWNDKKPRGNLIMHMTF